MAFLDYYIAGQKAGRERKTQAAFDQAAPFIAQAAGGDMGALKSAIAVPGLPTETVMQLGQWAASASAAEREAAAQKAGQVADFTTNYLRLPYQQRVAQWGAVQNFAKENGVEAPAVYDENFLNYYAMRSKGYADLLKGSGATSPYLAGSQPGGQGGYQPAPAGGMTTTPLPAVEGPVKNNNPGNIRNTGGPGFKVYATPEEGLSDMSRLLSVYQDKYGLNTVEGIISRWAPPTENNTPAYIGMVADALGVSPTDQINVNDPAIKQKLMAAMIQVEHGAQPFTPDQLLAAAGGAPGAASPVGASPAGGPTGGLPQGARMVLGQDGQPLSAGDGKVWFAPPDANGAPDWNQAVAVAPGGQGGGVPNTQGLPTGYQWTRDSSGQMMAAPIPGVAIGGDKMSPTPSTFEQENKLRDEYTAQTKDFRTVQTSYNRIKQAASGAPSGANDIAIVFGFMKMIDPTSVVREGEFATAENTAGVPDQIMQLYNRVLQGQRLPEDARANMLLAAEAQMKGAEQGFAQVENYYRGLAEQYQLNPDHVVRGVGQSGIGVTSGNAGGINWQVVPGN